MLLVAGVTVVACVTVIACILTVAGILAVAGVVGVSAVPFKHAFSLHTDRVPLQGCTDLLQLVETVESDGASYVTWMH